MSFARDQFERAISQVLWLAKVSGGSVNWLERLELPPGMVVLDDGSDLLSYHPWELHSQFSDSASDQTTVFCLSMTRKRTTKQGMRWSQSGTSTTCSTLLSRATFSYKRGSSDYCSRLAASAEAHHQNEYHWFMTQYILEVHRRPASKNVRVPTVAVIRRRRKSPAFLATPPSLLSSAPPEPTPSLPPRQEQPPARLLPSSAPSAPPPPCQEQPPPQLLPSSAPPEPTPPPPPCQEQPQQTVDLPVVDEPCVETVDLPVKQEVDEPCVVLVPQQVDLPVKQEEPCPCIVVSSRYSGLELRNTELFFQCVPLVFEQPAPQEPTLGDDKDLELKCLHCQEYLDGPDMDEVKEVNDEGSVWLSLPEIAAVMSSPTTRFLHVEAFSPTAVSMDEDEDEHSSSCNYCSCCSTSLWHWDEEYPPALFHPPAPVYRLDALTTFHDST